MNTYLQVPVSYKYIDDDSNKKKQVFAKFLVSNYFSICKVNLLVQNLVKYYTDT